MRLSKSSTKCGRETRRATAATPATAWRHAAFDAYAAHVESAEFAQGLAELLDIAGGMRTTIMCE